MTLPHVVDVNSVLVSSVSNIFPTQRKTSLTLLILVDSSSADQQTKLITMCVYLEDEGENLDRQMKKMNVISL